MLSKEATTKIEVNEGFKFIFDRMTKRHQEGKFSAAEEMKLMATDYYNIGSDHGIRALLILLIDYVAEDQPTNSALIKFLDHYKKTHCEESIF